MEKQKLKKLTLNNFVATTANAQLDLFMLLHREVELYADEDGNVYSINKFTKALNPLNISIIKD